MIETIIITASVTSVVSICVGYAFKQLVNVFLGAQAQWAAERRNMHAEWAKERSELLERVQRPEMRPLAPDAPQTEWVAPEPDDSHLVGQIAWDDAFLAEDVTDAEG